MNFSLFFLPLARGVKPIEDINEKVSNDDLQVLWIKFKVLYTKQTNKKDHHNT